MALRIRHISTKFILLLAIAAVVPLLAYGFVSLLSLQRGTRDSVVAGNQNVAVRAAEEIRRYVTTNAELLKALAADLQNTGLQPWQQERILRNYVLRFREYREITLFDEARQPIASSRVGTPRAEIPKDVSLSVDGVAMSPITIDQDLLPTTVFAIHLTRLNQPDGWLTGEFSLEAMWQMVDRIRIGDRGFALVIGPAGELIAHGNPDKKALVAQSRNVQDHPLMRLIGPSPANAPVSSEYVGEDGTSELGVATTIPALGWTVMVEQPTAEAYANAAVLRRQLGIGIALALFVMISVGYFSGKSFITPILTLKRATQTVASGQLDARVDIQTADEFSDLGEAFNTMANRLIELQENVKRQERQAMFGRVAAGLVHDLSHPIQNLGNSMRLLVREDLDAESRQSMRGTIERELETLKRFMDDLRNVVKPRPIERFPLDVKVSVAEIVDPLRAEGERVGVTVDAIYPPEVLVIDGDRFAIGRVFRNLITNAIQATQPGGRVVVKTARVGHEVEIAVTDTGSGIAPERLPMIFEDFVTTKRRGLGLGLAITKRIIEQLSGTIEVQSELGRGTTFTVRFAARAESAAQAAS